MDPDQPNSAGRTHPEILSSALYTFVPVLSNKSQLQTNLASIRQRWEKLIARHEESRKLTDLPVLTESQTQELSMTELASQVTIRSGQLNLADLADLDISPYYQHTAQLQQHREYANILASDITSATTYRTHLTSLQA